MEPDKLISDYQRRVAGIAEKAEAVKATLATLRGVDTSGDGAVTVTVNVQGGLEALSFGPAAHDLSLDALSGVIIATSRKARARAARAAADAVEPLVGADSVAMQELRERIPSDASLDEAVGRPARDGLNEEQVERAPAPIAAPRHAQQSRPRVPSDDDADDPGTGYTRGG